MGTTTKSFSKMLTFLVQRLTLSCRLRRGSFLASIGLGLEVSRENQKVVKMCVLSLSAGENSLYCRCFR